MRSKSFCLERQVSSTVYPLESGVFDRAVALTALCIDAIFVHVQEQTTR